MFRYLMLHLKAYNTVEVWDPRLPIKEQSSHQPSQPWLVFIYFVVCVKYRCLGEDNIIN